jgi:hypothetical protein
MSVLRIRYASAPAAGWQASNKPPGRKLRDGLARPRSLNSYGDWIARVEGFFRMLGWTHRMV